MTTFLLNSPVLTDYGDFRFEGPLSPQQARELLSDSYESAIGHESTANILTHLLGIEVPLKRIRVCMQPGDRAVVFRLLGRLPEGIVLDRGMLESTPYEFGLLTRLA